MTEELYGEEGDTGTQAKAVGKRYPRAYGYSEAGVVPSQGCKPNPESEA